MPRPQNDHDAIREALLETAEKLIAERGAISFSLSDIAAAYGMSQSGIYRYFESKEAFYEAMAGRWFDELQDAIDTVMASDLPVREKLYQFFATRLAIKRARYNADPSLFQSYMDLGNEHWEIVRGYVDLADHQMAVIIGEAMAEGYFPGLEIDEAMSVVNLMIHPFVNPDVMVTMERIATPDNLRRVVDTIFNGLGARREGDDSAGKPRLSAVS